MTSPEEVPQLSRVYFLKPTAITKALVIVRKGFIEISEDDGVTWGRIPDNQIQGIVPITERPRK